mmetsp:Transcript_2381/g.3462  ORF Transcript_2381/g.3462 Transcript_2381/m.3462 type:complete len:221 (-) Transcript_2381:3554-4216(-)|eukprot:CAMPEP_0117421568 /NCGR_PEP_ID=MMETSP0758-20121206/2620_1 /TAXON_ID=63605 /ORGANISM="Percolomonas cosmopolitus, Strain AE-1 (ATCC 50343)" /LENGTH=220 /DNA_ID=CAMNT_0005203743 /DNA_START=69 /DNA_END=731 /DNA_ORIENTATION=+
MPKSRRDQVILLNESRYKRITRDKKEEFITQIQECMDKYPHIYVLDMTGSRTKHIRELRMKIRDNSTLIMARNKVMAVAFGKTPSDSYKQDSYKISEQLTGVSGVLFTTLEHDELFTLVNDLVIREPAVAGFTVSQDIVIEQGKKEFLPFSLEEEMVYLGLPIKVTDRVIDVLYDYQVCKAGQQLNAKQAKLLKIFGYELNEFHIKVKCHYWDGNFQRFK